MVTKTASATPPPLSGQVAVITGAGRGIGRAIALKLAELGAHTVLCGRSRDALVETAAAIENNAGRSDEPTASQKPRRSGAPAVVFPTLG